MPSATLFGKERRAVEASAVGVEISRRVKRAYYQGTGVIEVINSTPFRRISVDLLTMIIDWSALKQRGCVFAYPLMLLPTSA